jgi:hypothetical protein
MMAIGIVPANAGIGHVRPVPGGYAFVPANYAAEIF